MYFAWAAHNCRTCNDGRDPPHNLPMRLAYCLSSQFGVSSPLFTNKFSGCHKPNYAPIEIATQGSLPPFLELLCRGLQLGGQSGGELLFASDFLQQFGRPCCQEFCKLGLVLFDPVNRHRVQVPILNGPEHRHLDLNWNWTVLGLLEDLHNPLTPIDLSLPATCFMALSCAAEPTRETERPTEMAGRTPW